MSSSSESHYTQVTPTPNDFQVVVLLGACEASFKASLIEGLTRDTVIWCEHHETLEHSDELLSERLPDMVVLMADAFTQQGLAEHVDTFCQEVRDRHGRNRPVLVVVSDGSEDDRIRFLTLGADDVMHPDMGEEEMVVRLLVHLRRNLDAITHEVSGLPTQTFLSRVFYRRLQSATPQNDLPPWSMMVMSLDHLDVYLDNYGELATAQVLKTFSAMLARFVMVPDAVCHMEGDQFVVLTQPARAEKIASILCRQFETVSPNFYSNKDRKQGYMIQVMAQNTTGQHTGSQATRHISRRVPLMNLSIGIVGVHGDEGSEPRFQSAFNDAMMMQRIARLTPKSHWHVQRTQLSGGCADTIDKKQDDGCSSSTQADAQVMLAGTKSILVVESDAAMAFLLKSTLALEGYEVETVCDKELAEHALVTASEEKSKPFDLVILDSVLHGEETGLTLNRLIRDEYPSLPVISISTLHDRDAVLRAGADLYLPKPFDVASLFYWVHHVLRGQVR